MRFTKKIVDGTGKWLLRTPLKDVDRREIFSLFELIKSEVDVVQQAIQDVTNSTTADVADYSSKFVSAIKSHVSLLTGPLDFSHRPVRRSN
jgi:hypothetical protein